MSIGICVFVKILDILNDILMLLPWIGMGIFKSVNCIVNARYLFSFIIDFCG